MRSRRASISRASRSWCWTRPTACSTWASCPDIKRILALLPAQRQNLLFSATFSEEIKRLANQLLRSPLLIEVARRNAPADLVKHQVFEVPALRKRALLAHLIRSRDMKQVLVFVRMKRDANRLARELVRDGIAATAIHSDRTQAERELALQEFKDGKATVLVATDIAARGIDIEAAAVRGELRAAVHARGLRPPHRPHRPRRLAGRSDIAHVPRRNAPARRNREAAEARAAARGSRRITAARLARTTSARRGASNRRRPPSRERHTSRATAPQKTVDASGFDFSKPYEPEAAAASHASAPPPRPRGGVRPVAALLGGFSGRDKDKK